MGFESRATASYEYRLFSVAADSMKRKALSFRFLKQEKILCKITTSPFLEYCLTSAVPNLDQQLPAVLTSNNDIDPKMGYISCFLVYQFQVLFPEFDLSPLGELKVSM